MEKMNSGDGKYSISEKFTAEESEITREDKYSMKDKCINEVGAMGKHYKSMKQKSSTYTNVTYRK